MKRITAVFLAAVLAAVILGACRTAARAEDSRVSIPVPRAVGTGVLSSAAEEEGFLMYESVREEDLAEYLWECTLFGSYATEFTSEDWQGGPAYFILAPGQDVGAEVYYDKVNEAMGVVVYENARFIYEDALNEVLDFVNQEITRPADAPGQHILPQFWQVLSEGEGVVRNPDRTMLVEMPGIFDGQSCWCEYYLMVDYGEIVRYTRYLAALGFDVTLDAVIVDEANLPDTFYLHYSNGEAETILQYSAQRSDATLFYKPGISYYLLSSGEEMETVFSRLQDQ